VKRARCSYTHFPGFVISPGNARCCNSSCTDNTPKIACLTPESPIFCIVSASVRRIFPEFVAKKFEILCADVVLICSYVKYSRSSAVALSCHERSQNLKINILKSSACQLHVFVYVRMYVSVRNLRSGLVLLSVVSLSCRAVRNYYHPLNRS